MHRLRRGAGGLHPAFLAQSPQVDQARKILGQFYLPFLNPLRQRVKPIQMGSGGGLDVCPWILLLAVVMVRWLLVWIVSG